LRPAFDGEAFNDVIAVAETVPESQALTATAFPTNAPTPRPTKIGFSVVRNAVTVPVVEAVMAFPVTVQAANSAVFRAVFERGMEAALGEDRAATITRINDIAVDPLARRRTADAETSVTFEIESKIASDTTANGADVQDATVSYMMNQLQQDINQAATSGSIVANILTQAIDSGVLTNELKAMPLSQQVSMTRTVKTKEVDVNVPMSSTATYADHAHHLAWWAIFLIVVVAVLLIAIIGLLQKKQQAGAG
jgi:hypothetical protein